MQYIDGNWIDICSLLIAIIYAYVQWRKGCAAGGATKFISKNTATIVANGTSLFPMFLLGLSVVSSALMQELLSANRLILSVAGIAALFAILDD